MKKNLVFLFIIAITNMFFLSGCWNYTEIDRLAIVSGLAIDKNEKGDKFFLTAEIIDVRETMNKTTVTSKRIDSEGETIFDGMRNMIKVSGKKLYWSHAKTIVISQDVAKENIIPVIDWVTRDQEPRLDIDLLISKEKTAKELLSQQSVTTDIRAMEMDFMLSGNKSLSKVPKTGAYEFINALIGEGISATLPAIGITLSDKKRTSALSGTAVFNKDKLVGFISGEETKYFLFVVDKIKGGLLTVDIPSERDNNITLEIFKNKTKITPVYSDGKLSIKVDIKTEVSIGEEDSTINYIDEKGRVKLKKYAEKSLETHTENLIKKVQDDFGSDIFGFGAIVKKEMPSLWKGINGDWDKMFKDLEVKVSAEIKIRNSAMISKPIKVGD